MRRRRRRALAAARAAGLALLAAAAIFAAGAGPAAAAAAEGAAAEEGAAGAGQGARQPRRRVAFALPQPEAGAGAFVHVPHRELVGSALARLAKPRASAVAAGIDDLDDDILDDVDDDDDDDAMNDDILENVINEDAIAHERATRRLPGPADAARAQAGRDAPLDRVHPLPVVHGYALVRRLTNFQPTTWPLAPRPSDETLAPSLAPSSPVVAQAAAARPETFLRLPQTSAALALRPQRAGLFAREWCAWDPVFSREVAPDAGRAADSPTMDDFKLHERFAAGSQGEVWEAFRVNARGVKERFVLKRVFLERDASFALAGQREAVFGKRLRRLPQVARFVEAFNYTQESPAFADLGRSQVGFWLVFRHEGESLDALLYSRVEASKVVLLEPSAFWHRMRRDAFGAQVRREILRQVCEGLVAISRENVAHRDIKPSNLLLSELEDPIAAQAWPFRVKLADFGSALDTEDARLNARLYGEAGPTMHEETRWYRPPEAFLAAETSRRFPYMGNDRSGVEDTARRLPYHAFDMWSLGVVALEMLLGSAHIFEVTDRTRARLRAQLTQVSYLYATPETLEAALETRCALEALQSFGIGPAPSSRRPVEAAASESGTADWAGSAVRGSNRTKFRDTVRERDPLKTGFYFSHAAAFDSEEEMELYGDDELDFVWWLLQWSPFDRPTPEQALRHPFFAHFT